MGIFHISPQRRTHWIFILTLLGVVFAGCSRQTETPVQKLEADPLAETEVAPYTRTTVELPLPTFSLATMSGERLSSDELKGKIVLINFWATWCGPCVYEIPEFVVLYDDWKNRNFEIVGVSMDDEGFELVKPFAEDFAINYPVVIDHGELADEIGGVYALPTTFIVDETGIVRERFIGLFPVAEIRDELDEMIKRTE